jgi:maltooligosyltrehalose trehalohydrolase
MQTFERSKLDWNERERGEHREILDWYRQLIRLRQCVRDFENGRLDVDAVSFDETARWIRVNRGESVVLCNFAATGQRLPIAHDASRLRVSLASKPDVRIEGAAVDMPLLSIAILTPKDRSSLEVALK